MVLTSELVADFRGFSLPDRSDHLKGEHQVSLAGLFELVHSIALGEWDMESAASAPWLPKEEAWLLRTVLQLLGFHSGYTPSPLKGAGWRIAYLASAPEIDEHERFRPLDQEFVRAAVPPYLPEAFLRPHAGCLSEMITNVRDHSAQLARCEGALVGFHITPSTLHYAVADMGRGVRKSLADNPRWDGLDDDVDALRATLVDHASRRISQGEGEGFKTVIRSLVAQSGAMRLQSGEGIATACLRDGLPVCEFESCSPLAGLRVSVCMRGDGKEPSEEPLSFASPREHV